jgi:hypothetical protein
LRLPRQCCRLLLPLLQGRLQLLLLRPSCKVGHTYYVAATAAIDLLVFNPAAAEMQHSSALSSWDVKVTITATG